MLDAGSYQGARPSSSSMSGGKAKTAALKRRSSKSSGSTGRAVGRAVARSTMGSGSSRRSSGYSRRSSSGGGYSSRNSGRSGGGSSGGGGGGGGGGSSAPRAPKAPSLSQYLGTDSIYQSAVSGGKRSLNDFISELTRRRGEAGTQYTQTRGSMERDRTTQLDSLRDEFASRGLIQSGLYGQEQGNFQKKFTEQMTALEQQQAALMSDLMGQQKNYTRENQLALEAAKQEALLRRAQKYG